MKKELRIYQTKEGKQPFVVWLEAIKDKVARAQITNRLNRVTLGNLGGKSVGEGVFELRVHMVLDIGFISLLKMRQLFCCYWVVIKTHKIKILKKPNFIG